MKSLWAELAGDKTTITFRDLDPDAANTLDEFRNWMISSSGNILEAWHRIIDPEGREHVDEAEFLNKMVGRVKTPKKLFRLLLGRIGQRSLVLEDLESLLICVPQAERKAIWSGMTESTQESPSAHGSPTASTHAVTPEACSNRQHVNRMINEFKGQDRIVSDLKTFKKILAAKYGSLFSAWRKGLDVDQNGVVTFKDFSRACQQNGVKAVQKIWCEFDTNNDGQITLNELDAEVAQLFNPLEQLLVDRFGSTRNGWRKVFDKEGSMHCDRDKFVAQCKAVGFEGDADKLFKLVRPEPGRHYLQYDDLWINVNINEFELTHGRTESPKYTQGSPRSARAMSPHNRAHNDSAAVSRRA